MLKVEVKRTGLGSVTSSAAGSTSMASGGVALIALSSIGGSMLGYHVIGKKNWTSLIAGAIAGPIAYIGYLNMRGQ